MKPVRNTLKFIGKTYFPFFSAVGKDNIKQSVDELKTAAKNVFTPPEVAEKETFSEAVEHHHITKDDLSKRLHVLKQQFYIYATFAVCAFLYAIYLLFLGGFNAFLLAIAVTSLSTVFAFKRHFWIFQIKQKKLGCTLKEWWDFTKGGKHS